MAFTLCLDQVQTFEFQPDRTGVTVIRRAIHPATNRLTQTGTFRMDAPEARKFWQGLKRDGAFFVKGN